MAFYKMWRTKHGIRWFRFLRRSTFPSCCAKVYRELGSGLRGISLYCLTVQTLLMYATAKVLAWQQYGDIKRDREKERERD